MHFKDSYIRVFKMLIKRKMYQELEEKLDYTFKNKELLKVALTHKSAEYEHKVRSMNNYNERLEFLGDAILEHITSDLLFRLTPSLSEGNMTKFRASIVCERALSDVMRRMGASKYMRLGRCEEATNGRNKDALLADMFEAVLGAVYIDSDYDTANRVCLRLLDKTIHDVINGEGMFTDYKTALQEKYQVNGNVKIEYVVASEEGPDHDKHFIVEVYIEGKLMGTGAGKNKKEAQQMAAKEALKVEND